MALAYSIVVPSAIEFRPPRVYLKIINWLDSAFCLPWEESVLLLKDVSNNGELNAEALMVVVRTVEHVRYYGAERLTKMESSLFVSGDASLRRVALAALVALAATESGWNADRRERLAEYQKDTSPLVSGAAQFIFPPDEAPQ